MQRGVRVGRIRGIDISVHPSWIIAFGLISWSLAEGYFPSIYARWSPAQYWLSGIAGALLLFCSVLIHELSHSFVARARGFAVPSIVLFIFGGVSNIRGESRTPKDEFLISIVGPLTSFALAGVFWVIRTLAIGVFAPQVIAVLNYMVLVNVLLGAFNLIPGFPLDGGRVLRSIVWVVSGSRRASMVAASISGQVIGFLFIALGVWQVFAGNLLGGLWIAFIGWFLSNAAESSTAQSAMQRRLDGLRVAQLMERAPPTVRPDASIADLVDGAILVHEARAFPVVDGSSLDGLITLTDVRRVPRDAWIRTHVYEAMTPRNRLRTLREDDSMATALGLMSENDLNQAPVLDSRGDMVGLLTRADVMRSLLIREELGIDRDRPRDQHVRDPRTVQLSR